MTKRTRTGGGLRKHSLGSDLFFLWEPELSVDLPELPVVLKLKVDVEDGRLVVMELTVTRRPDGPPVSVNVLRSIPVASLTALAVAESVGKSNSGPSWSTVTDADALGDLTHLPELERVAVVYRWGYFIGENPTQWVAKKLEMSYAVAAKRVQAARLAGFLDPTSKGRKGA